MRRSKHEDHTPARNPLLVGNPLLHGHNCIRCTDALANVHFPPIVDWPPWPCAAKKMAKMGETRRVF
jgi:hypothetical protein